MFNILLTAVEQTRLIKALNETLVLLMISSIVSIIIGTIIGVYLANKKHQKLLSNSVLNKITSSIVSIIRSIPFILLMVLIIPITYSLFKTSIGFIPSITALILIGIATTARLVEQALVDINPDIYTLAKSLGANKLQTFIHFTFVEARSSLILAYTSAMISLVAYSSVVYIVGGGGLGYTAIQIGYYVPNGETLMYASTILMILIVQIIQIIGNILAKYFNKKKRGL